MAQRYTKQQRSARALPEGIERPRRKTQGAAEEARMDGAVREMLQRRWNDAAPIVDQTLPEFPGLYLSQVELRPLSHKDEDYIRITNEYQKSKKFVDHALYRNPESRALALLAWGPEDAALLENGRVPAGVNRHHEFQRSAEAPDGRPINDPSNLIYIMTGNDPSANFHHTIHGAILNPQVCFREGEEPTEAIPSAIVKSATPFYPPIRIDPGTGERVTYNNAQEVMEDLERMEPGITEKLPAKFEKTWGERIATISEVSRRPIEDEPDHVPFQVPTKYQEASHAFTSIYSAANREADTLQEARAAAANLGLSVAKSILPAGVYVAGEILPPDHEQTLPMPVVDGTWKPLRSKGAEAEGPLPERLRENAFRRSSRSVEAEEEAPSRETRYSSSPETDLSR